MQDNPVERVVGIYLSTQTVVDDLGYLEALQRAVGLNLVILSGGFALSPEVAALNPLGIDGQGPGFSWDADGTPLERAIELAHERGIRVWLLLGCWQIGAEQYPALCAQDLWGRRLTDYPPFPYCSEQHSLTFCPSNEEINAFYAAAYADVVRQYPIDGIDVTHARYTSPAFWPAIFSCACERCATQAEGLGFDWQKMRVDSLDAVEALKNVDGATLRRFVTPGFGVGDLLQAATGRNGVLDWLNFRATVIKRNLERFHAAVHQAANRPVVFGVDTFPPSVALFAGHRYHDFMTACDYTSPLLSHPAYFVLATVQSWVHTLQSWSPGLTEADALEIVYGLLGFDGVPLPRRLSQLGNGLPESEPEVPGLEELVYHDLVKTRLYNSGAVPSYPVLMGGLWPSEMVHRLTDAALQLGHEGVIYQQSEALTSYTPRTQ
jgi:hypothetical protein